MVPAVGPLTKQSQIAVNDIIYADHHTTYMTVNYKDSLHLPKTSFPMKAALSKREPILLNRWEQQNLYARLRDQQQNKPRYILHDGPPYANGNLHIGHAVNKILKDIIVKSKNLSGFNAPFTPGWDCHGLPIELNVEKKLNIKKNSYTDEAFKTACREYAAEQVAIQTEEFKRLGVLADWRAPYLTMDFKAEADIMRAFGQCMAKGYIEPGLKPIHWCVACQSALAELEVSYQDKSVIAIDVKFKVHFQAHKPDTLPGEGPLFIPIWTTTPWTLPSNEAVAIGPTIEYTLIQLPTERVLLASALYQSCLSRYGAKEYTVLGAYEGQVLQGMQLKHPFENRLVPLIESEHVLTERGTGAVHIAPSHGPEDYHVGLKYKLPLRTLVDAKGRYCLPETLFDQQSVLTADKLILTILSEQQALLAQNTITHSYPCCWRHNIPLIFRATPQWFLRLQDTNLSQQFNQTLTQVNWIPAWGEARMRSMLSSSDKTMRPDWCLSRQRRWGVPLPLFVHKQTGQCHPNTLTWIESISQAVEKKGIEAWYELDANTFLGSDSATYHKLNDVLDVWFDSGVTHETILKKHAQSRWPADLYLEGADQFRGWFQSSLITSVILNQQAPYKNVLTHGFTVDANKQKMSKSLGNTISLDKVVQQWGADIVRLWVASVDMHTEITVSEQNFQRTAEAYRRIRNTIRFLLANLHDFNPHNDSIPLDQLLSLDRWLLTRVNTIQAVITEGYRTFNFPIVYQTIHHFCAYELGSLYLSILKDRQYTMQANSLARRSGQTALYHVSHAMLRWLAPILSFTAEEAWEYLPTTQTESVFLTEWYRLTIDESKDRLADFYKEAGSCEKCWHMIINVRDQVNQAVEVARNQRQIGSALEANLMIYYAPKSLLGRLLTALQAELRFIFLTSTVKVLSSETLSHPEAVVVEIHPVDNVQHKCARCWHRCYEVGQDTTHPTLCSRCIQNLDAQGEIRYYA